MGVGIVLRRLLAFLPSVTVADLDFELRRGCGFNLLARLAFLPSAKIRGGFGPLYPSRRSATLGFLLFSPKLEGTPPN